VSAQAPQDTYTRPPLPKELSFVNHGAALYQFAIHVTSSFKRGVCLGVSRIDANPIIPFHFRFLFSQGRQYMHELHWAFKHARRGVTPKLADPVFSPSQLLLFLPVEDVDMMIAGGHGWEMWDKGRQHSMASFSERNLLSERASEERGGYCCKVCEAYYLCSSSCCCLFASLVSSYCG
jgi:hypothetical protein